MRSNGRRTYSAKPTEVVRRWLLIDGQGQVLGRLAADVAALLRGKHKAIYTRHVDTGDHVIVVNAAGLVLTGGKGDKTIHYRHSGYPGGLKGEPFGELLRRDPERAFRQAVKGMLPHSALGRQMLRKLKVYAGGEHPHAAQGPIPYRPPHAREEG